MQIKSDKVKTMQVFDHIYYDEKNNTIRDRYIEYLYDDVYYNMVDAITVENLCSYCVNLLGGELPKPSVFVDSEDAYDWASQYGVIICNKSNSIDVPDYGIGKLWQSQIIPHRDIIKMSIGKTFADTEALAIILSVIQYLRHLFYHDYITRVVADKPALKENAN